MKKTILFSTGLVFLLSGCGAAAATQAHPDYSIFNDVPKSQLNAIKEVVKKEDIKNLEFPTKVPFKITKAMMPKPAMDPLRKHHIDYLLFHQQGTEIHALDIQSTTDKQPSIDSNSYRLMNSQQVKLGDGTKALFGNNGAVSQLAWIQDGVLYELASSKGTATAAGSTPDLSKEQLIQVADSFN